MTSPTIRMVVPPDADHVPLLRTAVAGVAARRNFTLEEMDDLRMGVEEAAVLLVRRATGDPITLELTLRDRRIEATVSTVISDDGPAIDPDSFSWKILDALADTVETDHEGRVVRIMLTKHAAQSQPA